MIIYAIISLGGIGAFGAIILYLASVKFKVDEDILITQITEALPGAQCGGCGFPGCGGFAIACVDAESLEHLFCPVGGSETMNQVAILLGKEVNVKEPKIAVLRCNGVCEVRPRVNQYDGAKNCAVIALFYGGETGCAYGCFGFGDCVESCIFGAIRINSATLLAEVDEDKCTSCGACVKACPKHIIELRKKGPESHRIYVSCINKDKGAVARKVCANACIGCNKCLKECDFDAITIKNHLAYIDDTKCRLCRKCTLVCPTRAIMELNFPPEKESQEINNA